MLSKLDTDDITTRYHLRTQALSVSCVAKESHSLCAVLGTFQCSYIIQAYKKDNPLMV